MSIHLATNAAAPIDERDDGCDSDDTDDDDDQTFDDWASDSQPQQTKSLFDDGLFDSADKALTYDKEKHGFELGVVANNLGLDSHGRIRLINFIRKTKATPEEVLQLSTENPIFSSDEYLIPVIQDDPLLQSNSDNWSDDSDEEEAGSDPAKRVKLLERKLAQSQRDLAEYRQLISQRIDIASLLQEDENIQVKPRDDDTHYFNSYAENDIHAVMILDKVRTSTYASFILTNPSLFRNAVVMDVGCGTGILSLFAARAGAKRVFAIDASPIAEKAEKIVKANQMDHIITVIRGKVEDITLPDGIDKVDVIVSEWMGYALLYESMLDSVLVARDRFLRKPDEENESPGVMAPSQTTMMLSLCDASDLIKERITFWHDVYGFDLSVMGTDIYDEAIVDVISSSSLLSEPALVKDIHISTITPKQLDFSSPFTLTCTSERKTKIRAFVLYFDTFFTVSGESVPRETKVKVIKESDVLVAEVWPVGGRPAQQRRASQSQDMSKITSFSTGPESIPTHWKQTLFLLREPIDAEEGTIVQGHFHCKKSDTNSRELDVEIHYASRVNENEPLGETVVQIFKVR